MVRGILRLVAAGVVGVITAGSLAVTGYLTMLERGMEQNLEAVKREVAAEKSIQAQNAALGHMVTLTDAMGGRLSAMADTAESVLVNVKAVGEANRAVLDLNGTMVKNQGAASDQLRQVIESMDAMNRSARDVGTALEALTATVSTQKASLADILWYVTGMNTRTPEL